MLAHFFQSLPLTADGLFWITAGFWAWPRLPWSRANRARNFGCRAFWASRSWPSPFQTIFPALFRHAAAGALFVRGPGDQRRHAVGQNQEGRQSLGRLARRSVHLNVGAGRVPPSRGFFCSQSRPSLQGDLWCESICWKAGKSAVILREHSAPDARIAILGSEPEILFYARRHSATGYIYMYDLLEGPNPMPGKCNAK